MEWCVEYTPEFENWWNSLEEDEQESVNTKVILLQQSGPSLPRPHSDVIVMSEHNNMKELIIQHQERPLRVLYAFDREGVRSFWLAGIRPEITVGTTKTFR